MREETKMEQYAERNKNMNVQNKIKRYVKIIS